MKPTLYLDVYLLLNLLMNYVCLYTTGRILHGFVRKRRILLGALLGSFFALFPLLYPPGRTLIIIVWATALCLMCLLAFKPSPPGVFLSSLGLTFLFSVTAGGLFEMLLPYAQAPSGKLGLSLASGIAIAMVSVVRILAEKAGAKMKQSQALVRFRLEGSVFTVSGLCDSGNLLREPTSGLPVILLGSQLKTNALLAPYFEKTAYGLSNLYLIPVQSATGQKLLHGFRPQELSLEFGGKIQNNDRVIVAADPDCPCFADHLCLIPTSIL